MIHYDTKALQHPFWQNHKKLFDSLICIHFAFILRFYVLSQTKKKKKNLTGRPTQPSHRKLLEHNKQNQLEDRGNNREPVQHTSNTLFFPIRFKDTETQHSQGARQKKCLLFFTDLIFFHFCCSLTGQRNRNNGAQHTERLPSRRLISSCVSLIASLVSLLAEAYQRAPFINARIKPLL